MLCPFLNDFHVREQSSCKRIEMGKIEVEGVLSLKECKLNIKKRARKGINSL